jgi:fructose-specific phosphotransferase system IIC component
MGEATRLMQTVNPRWWHPYSHRYESRCPSCESPIKFNGVAGAIVGGILAAAMSAWLLEAVRLPFLVKFLATVLTILILFLAIAALARLVIRVEPK